MKELLKGIFLKYFVRYQNPKRYWDMRWKLHYKPVLSRWTPEFKDKQLKIITNIMKKHDCKNILEVGCGMAHLRDLPNYLGLDFSVEVLMQSGLQNFFHADITNGIPLPTKSYDAVLSMAVLLHIPFDKIDKAVAEISRVAKKCIILYEPWSQQRRHPEPHCFSHDLPLLFNKHFNGIVVFVDEQKSQTQIAGKILEKQAMV